MSRMQDHHKQSLRSYINNEILGFLCILVLAGTLRWLFSPGIGRYDEILYANSAHALTRGVLTLMPIEGAGRIGVYAPVALLYYLFGPSEGVTQLAPFVCSLITVFFLYRVVRLIGNKNSATLAILFWALNPLSIAIATSNYPDTTMAMVNIIAVYAWLLANRSKNGKKIFYYFLCLFFLAWGVLAKQQIIITFVFLFLASVIPSISRIGKGFSRSPLPAPLRWGGLLLTVAMMLFFYGSIQRVSFPDALAITSQDAFGQLSTQPFFYITFPFLIITLAHALRSQDANYKFVAAWFGFTFITLEWAPLSIDPAIYIPGAIRPLTDRTLLFLLLPVAIMSGLYLEEVTRNESLSKLIPPICGLLVATTLLSHSTALEQSWVLTFSALAIFFFIALSTAIPFLDRRSVIHKHYLVLFFVTLGVSILNPLHKNLEFTYWDRAYYQNLKLVSNTIANDTSLIFFHKDEDRRILEHLNFVSGFRYAPDPFNDTSGRMRVYSLPSDVNKDAYVIVTSPEFLEQAPSTWQLLSHFSQAPSFYFSTPPELWLFHTGAQPEGTKP